MPDRQHKSGDRVKCSRCGFSNAASHKFCAGCGAKLPAAAPAPLGESRTKAQKLIEEAFREFEKENLGEAILLGEAAVALDPANAAAHSLLGTIYDTKGQVGEAIRCFEKAVELSPDSAADRERLEALRLQSVAMTTSVAKLSPARTFLEKNSSIILVAVATAIVVFLIMLPIVLLRGRSAGQLPPSQERERMARAALSGARPVAPPPSQPGTSAAVSGGPTQNQASQTAPQRTTGQAANPFAALSGASSYTSGLPPVLSAEPLEAPAGMRLPPGGGTASEPSSPTRPAREEAPSITLSLLEAEPTATGAGGGGSAGVSAAPLDLWALGNRARTFQGSGMYKDAIDNYAVIMDAAPSGRVAQQLGICYQRVGDQEKAREAYKRAIDLFNEDVSAGRNTEEAQQGIRSCETGLRILGGG
jgi:tetratricopeptide (TPR) repeat protein